MLFDEVHKLPEGNALFVMAMRPEWHKSEFAELGKINAKEIFKPVWMQRVTFHVEEKVTSIRLWYAIKSTSFWERYHITLVFTCRAFVNLQRSLLAQTPENVRIEVGYFGFWSQCSQGFDGFYASISEFVDL